MSGHTIAQQTVTISYLFRWKGIQTSTFCFSCMAMPTCKISEPTFPWILGPRWGRWFDTQAWAIWPSRCTFQPWVHGSSVQAQLCPSCRPECKIIKSFHFCMTFNNFSFRIKLLKMSNLKPLCSKLSLYRFFFHLDQVAHDVASDHDETDCHNQTDCRKDLIFGDILTDKFHHLDHLGGNLKRI